MAVLKAAQEIAPSGIDARIYASISDLPHFNPDHDRTPLHSHVAALRFAIGAADALLFCTPEYAGALSGSFKNLLDWTVGGIEMDKKPVAWINAASVAAPTVGDDAHASLRKVMGYVGDRIVDAACAGIVMSRRDIELDGNIRSASIRSLIADSLLTLATAVRIGVR